MIGKPAHQQQLLNLFHALRPTPNACQALSAKAACVNEVDGAGCVFGLVCGALSRIP